MSIKPKEGEGFRVLKPTAINSVITQHTKHYTANSKKTASISFMGQGFMTK